MYFEREGYVIFAAVDKAIQLTSLNARNVYQWPRRSAMIVNADACRQIGLNIDDCADIALNSSSCRLCVDAFMDVYRCKHIDLIQTNVRTSLQYVHWVVLLSAPFRSILWQFYGFCCHWLQCFITQ